MWVPPRVAQELREQTQAHNTAVQGMFDFDIAAEWNQELRKIDPLLRIAKAKERAHAPGVVPGYYHLVRINPGAPLWVQPLHDQNGQYVEPSSAMLNWLRGADLQNPVAVRDRQKLDKAAEKAAERTAALEHEQRVDTMMDRWKAASQVRIPFNTDSRWSQNVAGLRGRRERNHRHH